MNFAKGLKTFIYGAAVILLSILANEEAKAFIMEHFKIAGAVLGFGIIVLRALTNSPIFSAVKYESEKKACIALVAVLLAAGALSGCASVDRFIDTPRKQYASADAAFKVAAEEAIALKRQNILKGEKAVIVGNAIKVGQAVLDGWHDALMDQDGTPRADLYKDEAWQIIINIESIIREVRKE